MHEEGKLLNAKMHLQQSIASLEQNEEQLQHDLNVAKKEAQWDMYDASNQKLQTLILSSTVMFGTLAAVMIQPERDHKHLIFDPYSKSPLRLELR